MVRVQKVKVWSQLGLDRIFNYCIEALSSSTLRSRGQIVCIVKQNANPVVFIVWLVQTEMLLWSHSPP